MRFNSSPSKAPAPGLLPQSDLSPNGEVKQAQGRAASSPHRGEKGRRGTAGAGAFPAALRAIALLAAALSLAAPARAAAPLDPLTEACGVAFHQSVKPLEAVVWTGRNGNRVVILGIKGDRFECLFEADAKPAPHLLTVETTAADKSVTILTGKSLDKLNALIRQHFSEKPPASRGLSG